MSGDGPRSALDRISPALRRAGFVGVAVTVFVGTHWPNLQIPGKGRPDLAVHLTIFGTWTLALIACGFFGPVLSLRNIGRCALIAPVYAAFDESTQAIPMLRRTAAWDDYAFNCAGIALACAVAIIASRLVSRKPKG